MFVRFLASLLALTFAAPAAMAAHPLQTEDTGTQGPGSVEIENGLAQARQDGTRMTAIQPQVSLGLGTSVDAILQPSLVQRRAPGQSASGGGDTNVDGKWRFWDGDRWSLGVRAGLQAPTSRHGLGLPRGQWGEHALLVATWCAAPAAVHANLGLAHAPAAPGTRATTARVSTALMRAIDERLVLVVDGGFGQDPDARRRAWPGSVLGGAIWTARPGLDLDVGYQRSVDARPVGRQWMAGLTFRFSL